MPAIHVLRSRLGLTRSYRPNQVVTKAIRTYVAGGDPLIEAITLTHQLTKKSPDPQIADIFQYLKRVREAMSQQVIEMA